MALTVRLKNERINSMKYLDSFDHISFMFRVFKIYKYCETGIESLKKEISFYAYYFCYSMLA